MREQSHEFNERIKRGDVMKGKVSAVYEEKVNGQISAAFEDRERGGEEAKAR